ncbi:MAG: hypothetical protein EOO02_12285, partial [Chitinophagaceae bacterium]
KHDLPFLIVDDEADNASLNNMGKKGKEYASKVNGYIRALLGLFNRKTYLGYTATPFANVLQDRNEAPEGKWIIDYKVKGETVRKTFDMVDNIFPDDFIELLFPPSNYIGAKHFFETRIEEIKKIEPLVPPAVTDYYNAFPSRVDCVDGEVVPAAADDTQYRKAAKDDPFPHYLPESLKEAIQCYILSVAIRLSRKQAIINSRLYNPHNTMLIHISRFTAWQNRTKVLVDRYVHDELEVQLNTSLPGNPQSVYGEFERTWYKYYAHVIENIRSYLPDEYEDPFLIPKSFEKDIKPLLLEAVRGIDVKAINSETGDSLQYPDQTGKKYIAIGGNRLSRGFTLEGLTINYFIRGTDYADTLLQMGRWFGYRPGYLDCCKLFTNSENIRKFDLTTLTIEELEQEFRMMSSKNRTPRDFVLRVKTHPKVLKITRSSIMKNTIEERVDFSGDIEQSTKFQISKNRIEKAWQSFREHIQGIRWETDDENDFFICRTDSKGLAGFLALDNTFVDFETQGLPEWLNLCNAQGKLTQWTIAIKRNTGTKNPELSKSVTGLPEDMRLTVRRGPAKDTNARESLLLYNIFKASGKSAQIVAAGADFSLTLLPSEKEASEKQFREQKVEEFLASGLSEKEARDKARKVTIPDKVYRMAMNESDGILVIYLISLASVFEVKEGEVDPELQDYATKKELNTETPLIGYAIGFPKVSGGIGGTYVRGDYQLQLPFDQEEGEDEFDEALIEEAV